MSFCNNFIVKYLTDPNKIFMFKNIILHIAPIKHTNKYFINVDPTNF